MLSTENETKAEYVRLAQYELREELGSGQYGVVRQVRCQQTNKDYAMKIIR
jgi:serine/threonine protein kinase